MKRYFFLALIAATFVVSGCQLPWNKSKKAEVEIKTTTTKNPLE